MSAPVSLAACISGGGRTMVNLARRIETGELNASIDLVIATRQNIAGVERARELGLDVQVASTAAEPDETKRHDAITRWLVERGVQLVCLCGYLRWFRVDPPFRDKVINIHPALLPDFGGQGMYGLHVHRAVLAAGRRYSGCTVHVVDDQYDHGPTILQRACPVLPDDDPSTLADRVFEQECQAYPEAVELFIENRVRVVDGRVLIALRC